MGSLDKLYEIVLGNPPFLATSFVLRRDELENTFTSARGRYDYSYLFVEQAIKILTMGGHLGMVAPNRLYKNRNGTVIRDLLTSQTDLLTLIDFGSTRPFDASSYIGCIVARRRDPSVAAPDKVRVLEVRSLDPNFLAALLLKADQSTGEMNSPAIRAYFARHPHSGAPWALLSENEERARILIEDVSARLDSIADIPQGIRTGGNDLFIFEIESTGGSGLCKARNGLGEERNPRTRTVGTGDLRVRGAALSDCAGEQTSFLPVPP